MNRNASVTRTLLMQAVCVLLALGSFTCKSSPVGPHITGNVQLTADYVTCTEVWLKIAFTDNASGGEYRITRDGDTVLTGNLIAKDTLVIDSTAQAEKDYTYRAYRLVNSEVTDTSEALQVRTMDTTSHDFAWHLFRFGDNLTGNGSMLYDVGIINDSTAFAVGEIYMNDSATSYGDSPYNAARWNGKEWKIERIPYHYQGSDLFSPIRSIVAFDTNDIWYGIGNLIHWDGKSFSPVELNWGPSLVNGMAGLSSGIVYAVGDGGRVAHYEGSWQVEIGMTSMTLFDVSSNNGADVYASGGNVTTMDGVLLRSNNGVFDVIEEGKGDIGDPSNLFKPFFAGMAKTVWASNSSTVYFGGNLLYRYIAGQMALVKNLPGNYLGGNAGARFSGFISKIRGNGDNDMVIAGERNTLQHFNGVSWRQLGMPYDSNSPITWQSVAMKGNLIVAVGFTNASAVAIVLNRK